MGGSHRDLREQAQIKHCNLLKRIKKNIPENEYLKLYDALFLPHLTFCISVWGGVSTNKLAKIFHIQKNVSDYYLGMS